jgi:sterol carrier protein 2
LIKRVYFESPTSDGSAAVVLASEDFVRKHHLESKAVEVLAIEMATDLRSTFDENDCMKVVGYDMTREAARKAFTKSGIKPSDIQVVELHDCFSANELISYDALGLCDEGKAVELVQSGNNTYGGKYVVNPSGGLISKVHSTCLIILIFDVISSCLLCTGTSARCNWSGTMQRIVLATTWRGR